MTSSKANINALQLVQAYMQNQQIPNQWPANDANHFGHLMGAVVAGLHAQLFEYFKAVED